MKITTCLQEGVYFVEKDKTTVLGIAIPNADPSVGMLYDIYEYSEHKRGMVNIRTKVITRYTGGILDKFIPFWLQKGDKMKDGIVVDEILYPNEVVNKGLSYFVSASGLFAGHQFAFIEFMELYEEDVKVLSDGYFKN